MAPWLALLFVLACADESDPGILLDIQPAVQDVPVILDVPVVPSDPGPGTAGDAAPAADEGVDTGPDEPECTTSGCPGDPCETNDDCESELCVWHLGDRVCTRPCIASCPDGWSCEQVSGAGADLTFACVSEHPTLCLPCHDDQDCSPPLGAAVVCLEYGPGGRFCAAPCSEEDPGSCPSGYDCTGGVCRLAADECPCTAAASAQGLSTSCAAESPAGSCPGARTCGPDGLSPCDAPIPSEDICDGADNDCDGAVDTVPCDDGDPCTVDSCAGPDGCQAPPASGEPCDDADACTGPDTCEGGVCIGAPIACDDADPCTADACVPSIGCVAVETGSCSCTVDEDCPQPTDKCLGERLCVTTAEQPFPHCELDPETAIVCEQPTGPDSACLLVACAPDTGQCATAMAADGQPCSLGLTCTFGDACLAGACAPGPPVSCDDANPCTDDACAEGAGCWYAPNGLPCDDGTECTQDDTCAGVQCAGQPLDCNDADPCTLDECAADVGCVHTVIDIGCNDDNPCTEDTCQYPIGCVFTPVAGPLACDDNNACTVGDVCAGGSCGGAGVLVCVDDTPCTEDGCLPASGCVFTAVADGADCDDGDACTLGEACAAAVCTGGSTPGCDDNNPCTTDSCSATAGCQHAPANGLPCDDGSACTEAESCLLGWCLGTVISCADDEPCTDDTCDPQAGCVHNPGTGAPCSDGDACTTQDTCAAGACDGGPALPCNDGNLCTADTCDPVKGCVFVPAPDCCGNGLVESDEVCDDGGQQSGDGCAANCESEEVCGNGILDLDEACDTADFPVPCHAGDFVCKDDCQVWDLSGCSSWCGDGALDTDNEACDAGEFKVACWDGAFVCKAKCTVWDTSGCAAWCGDGKLDAGQEECDGEQMNPDLCPEGPCTCLADCTVDTEGAFNAKSAADVSCLDLLESGFTKSGKYWIDPSGPPTDDAFKVYCDMKSHGGGWTLVLRAGLGADLTVGDMTAGFPPAPIEPTSPGFGVVEKLSDEVIGQIVAAPGADPSAGLSAGYWVTTPGSGEGLFGAENFHRADCVFQMGQVSSEVKATTCHYSTVDYAAAPTWVAGGHWWDDSAAYKWAFGYANEGHHGTGNLCHEDGTGLGVHSGTWAPFHRGWCATKAWGLVYARRGVPVALNTKAAPGRDCLDLLQQGYDESGVYWLDPNGGPPDDAFLLWCDQTSHGGGWALVLNAGLGADLTKGDRTGAFGPPPASATQPPDGVLQKLSDMHISMIRPPTGDGIGYWVTTPGSGDGLLGAEIFHRADCTFRMGQLSSEVKATTCHLSTTQLVDAAEWVPGGHWSDDEPSYAWAFGYANEADAGTGNVCYEDGTGLGAHTGGLAPFNRGWCGIGAWGQVYARGRGAVTTNTKETAAQSCQVLKQQGYDDDGTYWIDPTGGWPPEVFQVYCDQTSHGGGWTLVLRAGLGVDLTAGDKTGAFGPPPVDPTDPGPNVLQKLSDLQINQIRTTGGPEIGYWVTTPGSGLGLFGAEIFHRSDCMFQMGQLSSQVKATTCQYSTTQYAESPQWKPGGHWWDNTPAYRWAFGYAQEGDHGTGGSCQPDGTGLGPHSTTHAPFHRGWCGTQAWGLVFVR